MERIGKTLNGFLHSVKKIILEVILRVQERRFAADLPERRRRSDLGRPFRDNVPNNSRIQVSAAGRQMGENNNHHSHLAGFHKIKGFWALKKQQKTN